MSFIRGSASFQHTRMCANLQHTCTYMIYRSAKPVGIPCCISSSTYIHLYIHYSSFSFHSSSLSHTYRLFKWSFDVAGQHSKEPLPMSQNHIIRAWMSHTGGWVLTATNAYSELAPDSNIPCDAGIGTVKV